MEGKKECMNLNHYEISKQVDSKLLFTFRLTSFLISYNMGVMVDRISKEHRSWNMSRVKNKNTKLELLVRSLLHRRGFRFRLHKRDLPGRPDIVLPKYMTVIFVHGCFWHQHKECPASKRPSTNVEFWDSKLDDTITRDKINQKKLRDLGWHVIVIWECEMKNLQQLETKLARLLNC